MMDMQEEQLLERMFVELPMANGRRVSLPQQAKVLKLSTFFCLLTLFSCFLQIFTDIQVGRETLILSLTASIISVIKITIIGRVRIHINFYKDLFRDTLFLSPILCIGVVIAYGESIVYQIITLIVFTITFPFYVYRKCKNNTIAKQEVLYDALLSSYFYLIFLTDCGLLLIPWPLLLLPIYLFFLFSTVSYVLKYLFWMKPATFEPVLETLSMKGDVILDTDLQITLIPTLFAIMSKLYLPTFIYVLLLFLTLSIDIVTLYFLMKFPEKTCIFLWNCHLQDDHSFFRTHQRSFVQFYDSETCDRVVEWNEYIECLTCQNRANIVYPKCGHVSVCSSCRRKLGEEKDYKKCIICGSHNDTVNSFYHKSEQFIYGHQTGRMMNIKLVRNQYAKVDL